MAIERPNWLPNYVPELDGLRGLAILGVVLYHSLPRFRGTWLYYGVQWGWSGVLLFFAMSGFLITSNLLTTRDKPRYFHSFHMRRVLRVWPVYLLTLAVCYAEAPWFIGPSVWEAARTAPWWAYLLFLQNLFPLHLPAALGPTWALAIEEQYYFVWAPLVKWLKRPWMNATLLIAALIGSPMMRHLNPHWLTPTHTLIKLDAIALGSLLALALFSTKLNRKVWLWGGLAGAVAGFWAAATVAGGTCFLDSALALGLGGAMTALMAGTGARNPFSWLLRHGPLPYYGKISYGLYLTHIMIFVFFGWVDVKLSPYGTAGNLGIVAFRITAATAAASMLWYGFERPILKLKRRF